MSNSPAPAGMVAEAASCLEELAASAEAQRASLLRGLALTEQALVEESGVASAAAGHAPPADGGGAAAERRRWWVATRLRLLQHLERLDTVLALQGGAWSAPAFAALRDCTVAEAAAAAAAAGRLGALPVLLARHPRALLPSMLDVLGVVPETLEAKQYTPLLREVASLREAPPLPRQPDWVENGATAAELRGEGDYALLLATEPMCAAGAGGGWHPPTQRQLARWVCERAQQLDGSTGQLGNAAALLEAGAAALHYSEPSVAALLGLAQELLSLVKLAAARGDDGGGAAAWRMDLRQYAALGAAQRLCLLLRLLGGDDLAADLSLWVAPFLARLSSSSSSSGGASASAEQEDPQVVLRQALESESARRLGWVARVVQCEARQRQLFASGAQLAKTAGACCYASGATDAWELLTSLLNAGRDGLRADHALPPEAAEAAAEALAVCRGHLTAARLLTKHGLTTPMSVVRDSDRAAALRLVRTLLARVSRSKNTESRWVEVWMDLRSIQEHGFTQLTEEEVRTELCRALLRVGQYRLCKSYLAGLPAAGAEQLVVAAGREVFLSASGMGDRAIKQAKECFALAPDSAAAHEALAGIAAGERLRQLGVDLPPLQLQQLQSQAATSGGAVLEQLLADYPKLAAADSATLGQVAAALGLAAQQQPLLLRAAGAALEGGDLRRAEGLLLMLAGQHFSPAWELAATVASNAHCRRDARQQLFPFALAAAPPDQLAALLQQWQACDSAADGAWELFCAAEPAEEESGTSWQEQQRWLARRLRLHLISLGRGGATDGDAAAALGCLVALGPRGLQLWEKLLSEPLPRPLGAAQRRQALLLGLTAGALLALQPTDPEPENVAAAAEAAEARLAASPAELLGMLQEQQQQRRPGQLAPAPSGEQSQLPASDAGQPASSSGVPLAAAAAATLADRFHGLLLAAADAQQLQRLLPGVDAAAALAGGRDSRRQLALQLAAAAGTPARMRAPGAAAAAGTPSRSSSGAAPSPRLQRQSSTASGGAALHRTPSRKKKEASPSPGDGWASAAEEPAAGGGPSGAAWQQLNAGEAQEMVRQALALGGKSGVNPWEVHLAFAEALLLHNAQQWGQPGAAAPQLLEAALPALLAAPEPATALLRVLLHRVWPHTSSRCPQHLCACLQLAQRCSAVLAAADGSSAERSAAAAFGACQAAAQQLEAASAGMDAKVFLQPLVLLLASALPAAADGSNSHAGAAAAAAPPGAAALDEQLLLHASSSNAAQLAAAVDLLQRQHAEAAAALAPPGASGEAPPGYMCSGGTVYLALFCSTLSTADRGGPAAAVEVCRQCLAHLPPAPTAAAAAFATTGGPCPLALLPGTAPPVAAALPEAQQAALLEAALQHVDSAAGAAALAADAALQQQVRQLRQRHALLAARGSLADACAGAAAPQLEAVNAAAASMQQAALEAGEQGGSPGSTASRTCDTCLQQLLTAGCPVADVLQAAALLQALEQQPEQAPPAGAALLAQPAAARHAQQAVAMAAEAAVAAALQAMSGSAAGAAAGEQQLSAGDAVQNLFALLRSLHPLPTGSAAGSDDADGAAAAAAAAAEAVDALRLLAWQHLQQHAAAYDGAGSAAATEAHLQVLELLGTVGTPGMWPGWQPPATAPAPAGEEAGDGDDGSAGEGGRRRRYSHQQALLFTRTAAVLAVEWPEAVQQCRLSAADFGSVDAAEGALLRLAAAAERAEQLRLLLRLLQEGLADAFPAAAAAASSSDQEAVQSSLPPAQHAVVPLHRGWAACLKMLLPLGDLAGALAALDAQAAAAAAGPQQQHGQEQQRAAAVVTPDEAAALLEAADATQGSAAAAALALLLPYRPLHRARWDALLQACGAAALLQACGAAGGTPGDLAAGLPGLAPLLLLVVAHQPSLLAELAGGGQQEQRAFKLLLSAALQQQAAGPAATAYTAPLGGSALALRTATAAAAAAHLASARQYSAAAWLAMEASATPRLLRVLDSGARSLAQLLRACTTDSAAAAGAAAAARNLSAGAVPPGLEVPHAAAALLGALPKLCAAALQQLHDDQLA